MGSDPLALDRERMRELGYRTVDALVDRLLEGPPLVRATPEEMRKRLAGAPDEPEPFERILDRLCEDVLPFRSRGDHPRFFAFVPFAGTWPGALGDFVASACNVFAGSWMEAAGPSQVELEVLDWFKDWIGFPATAAGSITSGGSVANLSALACAREARGRDGDVVAYVGDQAHSSIARAARLIGLRAHEVRVLPTDEHLRLRPETVAEAIDADRAAGRRPFFVSTSGGATNTGSVDPLRAIGDVCRDRGVWLHVDAAYGGFAALTPDGRAALDGIELADSVTLDPHKWLYQPYECGCILVRDGAILQRTFEIEPHYLEDARAGEREVNFADRGVQLTRSFRALKVWMSLRFFGVDAFRRAIERCLALADQARRSIDASSELELLGGSLGIVCFRRRWDDTDDEAELERRNRALVAELERSGEGFVSSTRLHGRYAIRLCVLSHTSGPDDVAAVLSFLERTEVGADAPGAEYERHPDVISAGTPIAALVSAEGEERQVAAGETIVSQLDTSRELYGIVEGSVEVLVGGERVRELGPGEFFGELAALDWGAGFGYSRLATVVATSATTLLVVPHERLNGLMRDSPELAAAIHAAVRERLRRI